MDQMEQLKQIVAENLGCDAASLTETTHLIDDLNADSLDMVELSMAVEEAFGISFSDEQLATVRTLGDMKALLENA